VEAFGVVPRSDEELRCGVVADAVDVEEPGAIRRSSLFNRRFSSWRFLARRPSSRNVIKVV
jgi:hypothetical protein